MADSTSELDAQFTRASQHVPSLLTSLNPQKLLEIYALYKQATIGPCNIVKPRFYELKAKEKYDAWHKLQQMTSHEAKLEYVRIICELDPEFDKNEERNETWVTVSTPVNTDAIISEFDKTIFDFCKENNLQQIREIVAKSAKIIASKDEHGLGLIHWAADRGNLEVLVFLVENNADVNMIDDEGQTALHYAASCDYFACVEFLLKAGADCHLCDNDGLKAVDLATDSQILKLLKEFM